MALEPRLTYRLVPRGEPGLTCDTEGVALGGIPVAWRSGDDEASTGWQVCSPDEVGELLKRAYGPQQRAVVDRCHRGFRRAAAQLEGGDLALAGIEALMLRLPEIEAEGMAKLSSLDFQKGGDAWQNEPRVPAGQPGGGQWTSWGASSGQPSTASRPTGSKKREDEETRQPSGGGPAVAPSNDTSPEITVTSSVHESRRQNANGFFENPAGGGTFYIPTAAGAQQVRDTEVHASDANAFQVSWDDNGVISLKDAKGTTIKVPVTTPGEVQSFNATTGRALGVTVVAFPGAPIGSPGGPPTPEDQRRLDEERAAFEAGRSASEQSWSGRVTTGAVLVATALPFLALAPVAAEAPVAGPLNTAEELWPESQEVSVSGNRAITQARSYEAAVRGQYPETAMKDRVFSTVVNGERVSGVPDTVAEIHSENTAVESKFVANWARSIRNPASSAGQTAWGRKAQESMVAQARKYADNFDGGVVYHTNSRELAAYYYRVFRAAGITKFRFIITLVGK